jgi:AraC-like DNA-binding protein
MITICRHALEAWRQACCDLDVPHVEIDRLTRAATEGVVPLADFVAALEVTAGGVEEKLLGWTVGERYDFQLLGAVGRAILSSSTLGAALHRFVNYFGIVQDATEFDIRIDNDVVAIRYRILEPAIWPRQHDALFTLSIIGQLLRRAHGFDWGSVQISLEGDDESLRNALSRRTGVPCFTKAETNMISFPLDALRLSLAAGAKVIPPDYDALNRNLAQKRRAMSIELRVQTEIYRRLGADILDQERVAATMGMSTRTLRRRLAGKNQSFQKLVYGCRMQQAAHEFRRHPDVSIAQTALRLGYSEHSALSRAFSHWSGSPPNAFLRDQRG